MQLTRAKFEHAIAVLIGKKPEELSIEHGGLTKSVPVVPAGVPSELLERRPDIAAAERTMASANALIGVAEAAWFPSVTLAGSYGFTSTVLPGLLNAGNSLWSFGPSLTETLFNGGGASEHQTGRRVPITMKPWRPTARRYWPRSSRSKMIWSTLRVLEQQANLQTTAVDDARNCRKH